MLCLHPPFARIHLIGRREYVLASRTNVPIQKSLLSAFALRFNSVVACQESHQSEPVTGVLFMRSTFAHGYRHGYEAGYHQGNIDINMARPPGRDSPNYAESPWAIKPVLVPRNSFLYGFQFGLMAGYNDGYGGREFRVISTLRQVAAAELDSTLPELKVRSSTLRQRTDFWIRRWVWAKVLAKRTDYRNGHPALDPARQRRQELRGRRSGLLRRLSDAAWFWAARMHPQPMANTVCWKLASNPLSRTPQLALLSRDMYSA